MGFLTQWACALLVSGILERLCRVLLLLCCGERREQIWKSVHFALWASSVLKIVIDMLQKEMNQIAPWNTLVDFNLFPTRYPGNWAMNPAKLKLMCGRQKENSVVLKNRNALSLTFMMICRKTGAKELN